MPLAEGTEAFVIVQKQSGSRSRSGQRSKLVGAARVRVLEHRGDSNYLVEVVAGSGVWKGLKLECSREELYITKAERLYFNQLVGFFWEGIPKTMERPPVPEDP